MKKYLIFAIPFFCYPEITKHELRKITNRLAVFDSEIKFLQDRMDKLGLSAQCWMGFLDECLELAKRLDGRIKNLSCVNPNKQCVIAAKYRLYRYLNILKCRLWDWRKQLDKERIEVEFDIDKFNATCTEACLKRTACALEDSPFCDIECVGDITRQKELLACVNNQLPRLYELICDNRRFIEIYLNRFDEIRDCIMQIAFEHQFDLCSKWSTRYPYSDPNLAKKVLKKADEAICRINRIKNFSLPEKL